MKPDLSVVIPVFNEEAALPLLAQRLYPALDALERPYEVLFVDDGSEDRSVDVLRELVRRWPGRTRVLVLAANVGQHMAILAAFEAAQGAVIVTLDADLQNPPEEIGRILAELDRGADYVGTIRADRQDSWWRGAASRLLNSLRERTTRIQISDQGCMLRGYGRNVIDGVNACREVSTFVPALAYTFARRPVEIVVSHAERAVGKSKYSLYSLVRLTFDLMTGFSVVPLQLCSLAGIAVATASLIFVVYLSVRRVLFGPEAEGLFTLFGIAFFLMGCLLFALGVVGEYVGRIYQQVRERPRYTIAQVLESVQADPPGETMSVDAPVSLHRAKS